MKLLACILILSSAVLAGTASSRPNEEVAKRFVSVRLQGFCPGGHNDHVYLKNEHESRDILATVRWRVQGGSFSTHQVRSNAGTNDEIGCAADAKITAARFLN